MAELIVYVDANFGGLHTHIFQSTPRFTQLALGGVNSGVGGDGNWNDIVSSFVIRSGRWAFYKNEEYDFQQGAILGPGLYSWVANVGIDNDAISSVKLISE